MKRKLSLTEPRKSYALRHYELCFPPEIMYHIMAHLDLRTFRLLCIILINDASIDMKYFVAPSLSNNQHTILMQMSRVFRENINHDKHSDWMIGTMKLIASEFEIVRCNTSQIATTSMVETRVKRARFIMDELNQREIIDLCESELCQSCSERRGVFEYFPSTIGKIPLCAVCFTKIENARFTSKIDATSIDNGGYAWARLSAIKNSMLIKSKGLKAFLKSNKIREYSTRGYACRERSNAKLYLLSDILKALSTSTGPFSIS